MELVKIQHRPPSADDRRRYKTRTVVWAGPASPTRSPVIHGRKQWASDLSSAWIERFLGVEEVAGSTPVGPTNHCGAARRFERRLHKPQVAGSNPATATIHARLTQRLECFVHIEEVGGSNPSLSTISSITAGLLEHAILICR